jgi:hypothetical protein
MNSASLKSSGKGAKAIPDVGFFLHESATFCMQGTIGQWQPGGNYHEAFYASIGQPSVFNASSWVCCIALLTA